jgi:hypothetical protein
MQPAITEAPVLPHTGRSASPRETGEADSQPRPLVVAVFERAPTLMGSEFYPDRPRGSVAAAVRRWRAPGVARTSICGFDRTGLDRTHRRGEGANSSYIVAQPNLATGPPWTGM